MVKLKLLGIGCRKSKALKENVLEALKALPPDVSFQEITAVDEIMTYDISAAPALLINDRIVFQDTVPSVEEIRKVIQRFSQPPSRSFSVSRILVPVDFSETAQGAFLYAQEFAAQFQASIKVVHVYHPEFDPSSPFLSAPLAGFGASKRKMLQEFIQANSLAPAGAAAPPGPIEQELLVGFPAEEILRLARREAFDLVIMGTTGEGGFLEKVFGSVSLNVSRNLNTPVLLVPNKVEYQSIQNILYASKYQADAENVIHQVAELAKQLTSTVHFVHVREHESNGYHADEQELNQILQDADRSTPFKMVTVTGTSVADGLNQYARNNKINLLVLGAEQRSFFEKLVHKSVTKRMLLNAKLPMLIFHFDKPRTG